VTLLLGHNQALEQSDDKIGGLAAEDMPTH